jgi:NADH:ubiquinone oxidoreductase subunit 3 (subunit A)
MQASDQTTQKQTDELPQETIKHSSPNESPKQFYDQISDPVAKITATQGQIKKNLNDKRQYAIITLFFITLDIATFFYKVFFNNKFDITWLIIAFTIFAAFMLIASFGTQNTISTL